MSSGITITSHHMTPSFKAKLAYIVTETTQIEAFDIFVMDS